MKWKSSLVAVVFGALGTVLLAQDTTTSKQTQTTTTTTQTVTGSVVQYSPGQTIVVRGADGKTTSYTIGSDVKVPAEVQIGKSVTILTQPSSNGSGPATVTRIETTTVSPQGQTKTTTERTETSALAPAMNIAGKVTAYQPRQSITVEEPGKPSVTYMIDAQSDLPQDIAVGSTVTITTRTVQGSNQPVIRTVTTKTVKTTTERKPE